MMFSRIGCGGYGKGLIQIQKWLLIWIKRIHPIGHTQILLHNFVRSSTVTIDRYSQVRYPSKSLCCRSQWMGGHTCCIRCKVRSFYLYLILITLFFFSLLLDMLFLLARFASLFIMYSYCEI
jgi:hypothetical protein